MIDSNLAKSLRLGLNVDHVATLRNARGEEHPNPVEFVAKVCRSARIDGITIHLREDRRHIRDEDVFSIAKICPLPINLEMAANDEMAAIAAKVKPNAVCLVPERREERTTEGGLDVLSQVEALTNFIDQLHKIPVKVSLFIAPDRDQVSAAHLVSANAVELHTGAYAHALASGDRAAWKKELSKIEKCAEFAYKLGLEVHAGHGLNYKNVAHVASIPYIEELNIGHFLIGEAVFSGIVPAVREMRKRMRRGSSSGKK